MEALAQCWFTRVHRPVRDRHRDSDGSMVSTCRYCHRQLVSWDRSNWNLAGGLDVSRLAELTGGRTLTLLDASDDLIVRRFPIRHLDNEADVEAFKQELRAQYGLDEPGTTLVLRDSAPPRKRKIRLSPPPDETPLADPL
ncbi:hypothetical protein [Novosphingobium sp. FSW06-99]|uniref:hypothetical protein n=1 Tax=Novosphingobium sp. FSW06-99 TaxID=1739113 RepID=UPI000836CC0E|nr:hypothetical protein [Novosphingobium sp. FSW06-99]